MSEARVKNLRGGSSNGRTGLPDVPEDGTDLREMLIWAARRFGDRLALSVSFGNPEGMVLLDMLRRIPEAGGVRIFTIDTGYLFEETVRFREKVEKQWGVEVAVVRPRLTVAGQDERHGAELFRRDPDLCCRIRKVEPQERALRGADAWITGIRREQTPQRANTPLMSWHERLELWKIAPLAAWSADDVRRYVEEHDVPVNPLLAQGYASIGCAPCTRPVEAGEDARAGRWSWTEKMECGLHFEDGKVVKR